VFLCSSDFIVENSSSVLWTPLSGTFFAVDSLLTFVFPPSRSLSRPLSRPLYLSPSRSSSSFKLFSLETHTMPINEAKLAKLQANSSRIGGKGTARRKKKVVHRTATSDDKKLQSTLKKLGVNNIPGVEEVNMIKDDGNVIHFQNPKVQAAIAANTFSITGHGENKELSEMLPGILNQLGPDSLNSLKRLAESYGTGGAPAPEAEEEDSDDDDVPDLVENFDEAATA